MASAFCGVCDAKECLTKIGDNALFIVERNFDSQIVVYTIELTPNKRDIKGVTSYWTYYDNLADRSPMGDAAKNMFYGVTIQPVKLGVYTMRLSCIPEDDDSMVIYLHIKKNGKVVPKVMISDEDGEKECTLLKIYTDLTRIPPRLNELWVMGTFKDKILTKKLNIDSNMMTQFDFSSFA
jgi:hypothetical protein